MGNFEKLSVLVIGVIIVMILVVALYTWTDDPAEPEASVPVSPADGPVMAGLSSGGLGGDATTANLGSEPEPDAGWLTWTEEPDAADDQQPDGPGTGDLPAGGGSDPDAPAADDPSGAGDLPAPSGAGAESTYTVKSGQTLSHISLEVYGTIKHWPKIAERNNIDPNRLRAGTVLIMPVVDATTPASNNKPIASTGSGSGPRPGSDYVVRDGDTIQKISQAAFSTIERWDDIWIENLERVEDPRFLRAGMTLRIPN